MIPLDIAGFFGFPRISPDGRRVAVEMNMGPAAGFEIWVYDIPSGALSRLTSNFTGIRPAGWTADGRSIVYFALDSSRFGGPKRIVTQPWDGSRPPRTVVPLPLNAKFIAGGPQNGFAVFSQIHMGAPIGMDIWLAPLDTPSARSCSLGSLLRWPLPWRSTPSGGRKAGELSPRPASLLRAEVPASRIHRTPHRHEARAVPLLQCLVLGRQCGAERSGPPKRTGPVAGASLDAR